MLNLFFETTSYPIAFRNRLTHTVVDLTVSRNLFLDVALIQLSLKIGILLETVVNLKRL